MITTGGSQEHVKQAIQAHPLEVKLHYRYRFNDTNFEVMIVCEGLQ